MSFKIGTRVGTYNIEGKNKIFLYGFGVYKGEKVPPLGVGVGMIDYHAIEKKTSHILLDYGKSIWGCECHFDLEDVVEKMLGIFDDVIPMDAEDMRRSKYAKA